MNKKFLQKLSGGLLSIILITNLSTSFAVTELKPTIEGDTYKIKANVKQSEEENYLSSLDEEISFDGDTYKLLENKKIGESTYNSKDVIINQENNNLFNYGDKEKIKSNLEQTISYDEDGYKGNLSLSDILIETVPQGYYEKIEYLDLDFIGYSQNELAKIEKEIKRNGVTWNLINVDWNIETTKDIDGTSVPITYSGVKHYQRIGTYANPNKYKATAVYTGKVVSVDPENVYEITYEKVPNQEPEKRDYTKPIIIGAIGILVLLSAIFYGVKRKKDKEKENK